MARALILVCLVLATGFDHARHAGATQQALACTDCHALTKAGTPRTPGHATCFGKCHGAPPRLPARGKKLVLDPPRAAVCASCHTQAALAGTDRKRFAIDPPRGRLDFTLEVGHARHAAVACAQCHPPKPPAPHVRCAGCHEGGAGKGPPMTGCAGCHVATTSDAPELPDARPRVRSAFSHDKHAARGGAGARCESCHRGVTETDARELPHPTAQLCAVAGCHDAKAAFPTTEACTRCHQDVPAGKYDVARPTRTFSHRRHLAVTVLVGCTTCHAVAPSGEVGLADHAQCAGCHADDFGVRDPKTCGACHISTEPWRALQPERPSLPTSEFGASLDHAQHRAQCASCHTLTTASAQLRPPRGHRACAGSGCHAAAGGAEPAFTRCVGCHELGLADRREAQRAAATWSVRARFVHAKHERAPDGSALACTACHLDMTGADLLAIATPPKSTCLACHDGQAAFKVTGTGCTRCHPGAQ